MNIIHNFEFISLFSIPTTDTLNKYELSQQTPEIHFTIIASCILDIRFANKAEL